MLQNTTPRIVGVDYGTVRVGLAVADPLGLTAQPHGTYPPDTALEELQRIQENEGLGTIIIGWPLTEAGREEEAVERVREYVNRINKALPDVEVVRWDERYTSELAKRKIAEAGPRKGTRHKKGRVDAAAAAIILQEYLDNN